MKFHIQCLLLLLAMLLNSRGLAGDFCAETLQRQSIGFVENHFLLNNRFMTGRTMEQYDNYFAFTHSLRLPEIVKLLPNGSVLVDMGAGQARALIGMLKANSIISKGVAISLKKPDTAQNGNGLEGRFEYRDGDFIENMYAQGRLNDLKGRVALLTDLYGPISYSENLPEVLQIYFDLLKEGGTLLFNFQTERNFNFSNTRNREIELLARPLKMNVTAKGEFHSDVGLLDWLNTIPGVQVIEVAPHNATEGQFFEKSVGVKIIKRKPSVRVPRTLVTRLYDEGAPPMRLFDIYETEAQARLAPATLQRKVEHNTHKGESLRGVGFRLDSVKTEILESIANQWAEPKDAELDPVFFAGYAFVAAF